MLILFLVRIFLTQLAIKRPLKFPLHPMYASALPGENGTHEISVEMNKKNVKKLSLRICDPKQPWSRSVRLQCLRCHTAASLSDAVQECRWTQEVTGWSLEQNIIDTAINEWRKHLRACVRTNGRYFEYLHNWTVE